MDQPELRDERGVAMLLELVLVAAVLALVGIALYQSNHHAADAPAVSSRPTTVSASGAADLAAKAVQQDSDSNAVLSATTESSADELTSADSDATNLGDSFNENNF
jgi:type II secretory pathway component PulK